jgi:hypothetical protein
LADLGQFFSGDVTMTWPRMRRGSSVATAWMLRAPSKMSSQPSLFASQYLTALVCSEMRGAFFSGRPICVAMALKSASKVSCRCARIHHTRL